jgi:uncharacterized protein (DUF2141 family)
MAKPISALGSVLTVSAVLAAPLAATPKARSQSTATITVQVIGLRNDKGVFKAALFDSAAKWAADKGNTGGGAIQRKESPIVAGTAQFSFSGIPYGTYALKGFHDEDRSGKFYTGMFGIPKVEVAFSNNAPIHGGPASFSKASFQVNQPSTSIVLRAQKI